MTIRSVAGPRFNFAKGVFAHALIGMDRLQGNLAGVGSASQNGFAAAFGGGIQLHVTRIVSFRTSADYVMTWHNIFDRRKQCHAEQLPRVSGRPGFHVWRRSSHTSAASQQFQTRPPAQPANARLVDSPGFQQRTEIRLSKLSQGPPLRLRLFVLHPTKHALQ